MADLLPNPGVHSFRPGCEITIWHRTSAGGPQFIYKITSLDDALVHASMGENTTVTVSKSLYDPAGEFQIAIPDKPIELRISSEAGERITKRDSLYGFLEPMDRIEIRMNRDQLTTGDMPVVLRGFVRGIGREEAMSPDGKPIRSVVISGHDCGCAFTILQVDVITAIQEGKWPYGANLLSAWGALTRTTGGPEMNAAKLPLPQFVKLCADTVEPILDQVGLRFDVDTDFAPDNEEVSPMSLPSFEGPMWNLLSRMVDRPWNEVFVREGPVWPEVVCRRTPWVVPRWSGDNPNENYEITAERVDALGSRMREIDMEEVIELRAHRDDSEVVTVVMVRSAAAHPFENQFALTLRDSVIDNPNNSSAMFGWRAAQMESMLSSNGAPQGNPEARFIELNKTLNTFLIQRREWLKAMWSRNADLENGSLQIRGRSTIHVGDYIHVRRGMGSGVDWVAYVTRVTHQYMPFNKYITTLEYIRSTQYLRRSAADNPWDTERRRKTA